MKNGVRHSAVAALLLVLAANPALQAQTNQASLAGATSVGQPAREPRWDLVIVDRVLRKGDGKHTQATLRNVVDYLRELYPANVVLAPGVGEVEVGDLKLASFQWEAGLEALRVASGNAFTWRSHPERVPGVDPTTGLPTVRREPADSDLLVLTRDESAVNRPSVEVFNMGGFVQGVGKDKADEKLNEVMMIIRETLLELGEKRGIDYRYHSGASLLVMSGAPEKLEIAKRILLALPQVTPSRADDPLSPARSQDAVDQFRRRYGLPPGAGFPSTGTAPEATPRMKF